MEHLKFNSIQFAVTL